MIHRNIWNLISNIIIRLEKMWIHTDFEYHNSNASEYYYRCDGQRAKYLDHRSTNKGIAKGYINLMIIE